MRTVACAAVSIALIVVCAACEDAPKVVQGTVVAVDTASHAMVVKDECPPNAALTLSATAAEAGAEVRPNDLVRVAYRAAGGTNTAVRVMNLSRQKDLGFLVKAGSRTRCGK